MATRCFGRARLAAGAARALVLRSLALLSLALLSLALPSLASIDFRAADLATVLATAGLRAGDFFCAAVLAAVLAAVRDFSFCLAIGALPCRIIC
jgi:hypothetical protein